VDTGFPQKMRPLKDSRPPAQAVCAAEAKRLFDPLAHACSLVLAVSGGPDSTALLVLAARWRAARRQAPNLLAVTIDHGLRPQSAREALAVKRLARSLGVPHRILRWQGRKPRTGLQEAARAARYRLLADFARAAKADHILTAHTLDDQAETVLMRMSRGSGMRGLAAMRKVAPLPVACSPRRRAHGVVLVRPLLEIPKARLVATLKHAGIAQLLDGGVADGQLFQSLLIGAGRPGHARFADRRQLHFLEQYFP
jgi:tRNA(Ile)-lysidine synthase